MNRFISANTTISHQANFRIYRLIKGHGALSMFITLSTNIVSNTSGFSRMSLNDSRTSMVPAAGSPISEIRVEFKYSSWMADNGRFSLHDWATTSHLRMRVN